MLGRPLGAGLLGRVGRGSRLRSELWAITLCLLAKGGTVSALPVTEEKTVGWAYLSYYIRNYAKAFLSELPDLGT